MKSNINIEGLERKVDQLLSRIEMLQKRLGSLENSMVDLRDKETRRSLQDEMWTK
jgi:predicted  nucleic acid-binding Zn-ribbon protein